MGRKHGLKIHFSARLWKDELGNNNVVYPEVQNTNLED